MTRESPSEVTLHVSNLVKKFDRRTIFKNISFELSKTGSLAVTGRNGSGKSTLVKILSSLLTPTSGEIELRLNGKIIERRDYYRHVGLVSPYLNLYDEFTGFENLNLTSRIRGASSVNTDEVLKRVGLFERRHDLLRIYSSGMKQRLKLAFSVIHRPKVLFLDEPTSNLDADGIKIVEEITEEYKRNGILIIATNDKHERSLCIGEINLNSFIP